MAADASRRAVLALVAGGLCLALAMAASLLARTGALSTAEAWHALTGAATSSSAHLIVWGVRLPRVLAACACGVSLAVSGALLQAALDNDLASPQVMGINAGAGFFALAGTLLFPFSGVARQLMALRAAGGTHRILIAEACTHKPLQEDIGRIKLPRLLRKKLGDGLQIDIVSGKDFPRDLTGVDLVIHCGACMFNRKYVLSRVREAREQGIAMTNYGLSIAALLGILPMVALPNGKKYATMKDRH